MGRIMSDDFSNVIRFPLERRMDTAPQNNGPGKLVNFRKEEYPLQPLIDVMRDNDDGCPLVPPCDV